MAGSSFRCSWFPFLGGGGSVPQCPPHVWPAPSLPSRASEMWLCPAAGPALLLSPAPQPLPLSSSLGLCWGTFSQPAAPPRWQTSLPEVTLCLKACVVQSRGSCRNGGTPRRMGRKQPVRLHSTGHVQVLRATRVLVRPQLQCVGSLGPRSPR